jgi:pimeloyl-ACP methyl ester carboxylesterase
MPPQLVQSAPPRISGPTQAIFEGQQKYTEIKAPVLAIYAVPHDLRQAIQDPAARIIAEAADTTRTEAQALAFQRGVPSVRIVRLPHANHYVFLSNEVEVLREINAFINGLPSS